MHVLYAELCIGCSSIVVFYDRVAYINRVTGLDMIEEISHIEGYCRNVSPP